MRQQVQEACTALQVYFTAEQAVEVVEKNPRVLSLPGHVIVRHVQILTSVMDVSEAHVATRWARCLGQKMVDRLEATV